MKNYTYDEQNSLNSLIINPRVAAWPHCSSFDIFWYPDQFIDFLLAESAMRIYIPEFEVKKINMNFNDLSNIATQHIEIIDKNHKIFNQIKSIVNDIESNLNWTDKNKQYMNYALNRLFELLYHLKLSTDYMVECDISRPFEIKEEIEYLISNSDNKEINSYLFEIIGILKLYIPKITNGTILYKSIEEDIDRRISDIMVDSTFLQLSQEKRNLSLTKNTEIIPKIKLLVRKLTMKKNYKKFIRNLKIPIALLPPKEQEISKPILSFLEINKNFSPTIIDVDAIADATLKRINPPPWDMDLKRTSFSPYSIYDFSANLCYKNID